MPIWAQGRSTARCQFGRIRLDDDVFAYALMVRALMVTYAPEFSVIR